MAPPTRGWEWPVEHTAMAALKSRKQFRSTSSTTAPAPRAGANAYARGSDGLVTRWSWRMTSLARGPGISVTSRGSTSAASSSYVAGETSIPTAPMLPVPHQRRQPASVDQHGLRDATVEFDRDGDRLWPGALHAHLEERRGHDRGEHRDQHDDGVAGLVQQPDGEPHGG